MTKLHLSDHDLQLAADATPLPMPEATHLRGCRQCQARVATYQRLFTATAHLPQPAFGFDLAAAVLAQLPQAKPAFPWVLVLVGILVLGVVGTFLAVFGRALAPVFQGLSTGLGVGLVLVAGFAVAGQCVELLARHRRQMRQLSFS
jgi:hypothetical protein